MFHLINSGLKKPRKKFNFFLKFGNQFILFPFCREIEHSENIEFSRNTICINIYFFLEGEDIRTLTKFIASSE